MLSQPSVNFCRKKKKSLQLTATVHLRHSSIFRPAARPGGPIFTAAVCSSCCCSCIHRRGHGISTLPGPLHPPGALYEMRRCTFHPRRAPTTRRFFCAAAAAENLFSVTNYRVHSTVMELTVRCMIVDIRVDCDIFDTMRQTKQRAYLSRRRLTRTVRSLPYCKEMSHLSSCAFSTQHTATVICIPT